LKTGYTGKFEAKKNSANGCCRLRIYILIITNIIIVIIIIGIQPLGRSGQRPEFSQATSMALERCILGKFLGAACHCFPPVFIYVQIKY